MISAATEAMTLLVVIGLVKDYGMVYLFAATLLTGFLQVLWSSVCVKAF